MDRGAWWATVHGVTKSRTRMKHKQKQYRRGLQESRGGTITRRLQDQAKRHFLHPKGRWAAGHSFLQMETGLPASGSGGKRPRKQASRMPGWCSQHTQAQPRGMNPASGPSSELQAPAFRAQLAEAVAAAPRDPAEPAHTAPGGKANVVNWLQPSS